MITHNGRVGRARCVGPRALGHQMSPADAPAPNEHVTAALLVIGDEILSGLTEFAEREKLTAGYFTACPATLLKRHDEETDLFLFDLSA